MKRNEEEERGRKRKGEGKDEVLSVVSLQDDPLIRLVLLSHSSACPLTFIQSRSRIRSLHVGVPSNDERSRQYKSHRTLPPPPLALLSPLSPPPPSAPLAKTAVEVVGVAGEASRVACNTSAKAGSRPGTSPRCPFPFCPRNWSPTTSTSI